MTITPQAIVELIEAELAQVSDPRVVTHVRGLLVPPVPIMRAWDYGLTRTEYACWSVLDHPASGTGIAYCESGFGPGAPWGLVWLPGEGERRQSMGDDSGWFGWFMQAYFDSCAAADLPIWRVFRRPGRIRPGVAVTEEASDATTWEEVRRLQALDPTSRYEHDCLQHVELEARWYPAS